MEFAAYIGYHTRNNLQYFEDVAFNPLETELLYFLNPFLLATLWRMNGFS